MNDKMKVVETMKAMCAEYNREIIGNQCDDILPIIEKINRYRDMLESCDIEIYFSYLSEDENGMIAIEHSRHFKPKKIFGIEIEDNGDEPSCTHVPMYVL